MALEKITSVTGRGVVIPGADIDTDRIIPARYLKCVTFEGLGAHLFADVRRDPEGKPLHHPLDDPRFQGASILIVGRNFGCGSSREHAPQAVRRAGFRAIIGASFGEIFFGNSVAIGLPCVCLAPAALAELGALVEADPALTITVDLARRAVRAGTFEAPVQIPESAREALVAGEWDPLTHLLQGAGDLASTLAALPYIRWSKEVTRP